MPWYRSGRCPAEGEGYCPGAAEGCQRTEANDDISGEGTVERKLWCVGPQPPEKRVWAGDQSSDEQATFAKRAPASVDKSESQ
eukprot:1916008-Pyramimonas_sp.AAC.1